MNITLMKDYVEYVADFLLEQLGYDAFYGKANPVSSGTQRCRISQLIYDIVPVYG